MLPPSLKTEIQEIVEEAIDADRNEWEAKQSDAAAKIATAIEALRDAQQTQTSHDDHNEKINITLAVVTIFLVFLTVVFTGASWWVFSGQLTEMRSAGEQTKQIIEANTKLVEAATQQAAAATETAKTSRESYLAAQRAWVGPLTVTVGAIQKDKGIAGTMLYQNTGKEPAANFYPAFVVKVYSLDEWNNGDAVKDIKTYSDDCLKITNLPNGLQVVYPSTGLSSYQLTFDTEKQSEPNKVIVNDDMTSGKSIFALKGCFTYKSIKEFHHSAFCFYYLANFSTLPNLSICIIGNDAD
jgi:hypothetical protein